MPRVTARSLRFSVQLQAQRTTWSDYLAAVQAVEEMGFYSVWNFDHMLPFDGADDGPCFETWTTLAAMAARTSRIRVGALVNGVLYRDPATLAKAAVQVDQISDGRLEFALGGAWAEREFRAYGLAFPPLAERLERLDEALSIVKSLWTQPRTTHAGRYYTLNNAPLEPKPIQRPHPPIMVGGNGRKTIRIAAKHADEWNCVGSAETCAAGAALLREACAEIGRDFNQLVLSAHPNFSVAATHEQAEARARALAESAGQNLDETRDRWVLGTPEEVTTQLQRYSDAGFTHWVFGVGAPFDLEGLRLFAQEVVPALY